MKMDDLDKAPDGGQYLRVLRARRRLSKAQLSRRTKGVIQSDELCMWEKGRHIPRTPRVINSLGRGLEIEPDLLWRYLRGEVDIDSLPASFYQKQVALPTSWVESLYPIVGADEQRVNRVLTALRDRILDEDEDEDEDEEDDVEPPPNQ